MTKQNLRSLLGSQRELLEELIEMLRATVVAKENVIPARNMETCSTSLRQARNQIDRACEYCKRGEAILENLIARHGGGQ